MNSSVQLLREELSRLSRMWKALGIPSHQRLEATADELVLWKKIHEVTGLWSDKPLLLTATLDDGIGQGLQIIHRYADAVGMDFIPLGLLQKPDSILDACRRHGPDFLGLTILQLDSDDDLCRVGHNLDSRTCLIAGGPVFQFDPEMADRCKVGYVARDVAGFIDFALKRSLQG